MSYEYVVKKSKFKGNVRILWGFFSCDLGDITGGWRNQISVDTIGL